jgi:hypothetical protein
MSVPPELLEDFFIEARRERLPLSSWAAPRAA